MFTPSRIIAAVGVASLGCVLIWVVTPYNNFLLRNGFISDDYFAHSVLTLLLFLVLVLNPLLRAARSKWAFSFRQMAFIAAILFVACSITSSGLLRYLPYSLATQTRDASEWKERADFYEEADLPPSLFPAELGYHTDVDVAKHFLVKLPAGESIPWGAWVGPALSWGCFFVLLWMLAIGLAGILLPQWQRNERMPMPLTRVLQSVLETPAEGRLHVKNPATCRQVSMSAALGLNGTESAFTGVADVLPNWERFAELERGFTATQRGGCYLAEDVAEDLGVAPGGTLMVAGFSLEVVGAYDPDALEKIVGLDGRSLLPIDYGAMPTSQRRIKMGMVSNVTALLASEVQSGAGMTLDEVLPYESASRTIVLPAPLLALMDRRDTSLRSMAVRTDTIETARAVAAEVGRRFAFPAFYGSPEEGVQILVLVPFLPQSPRSLAILMVLAGLIIFNTMMSSIADRKKEIYIYTSMGLAPLHIGVLFLAEAVTYGLMGSIFGYIAGQGLATFLSYMGWMSSTSLNYSGTHAIATMAMVVAITVVSSLIPAYLAGRMAVPSNKMRWAVPPPVNGVIEDKLPFTVTHKTADGILLYLHDYLDAHRDGTIGCFLTDRLEFVSSEEGPALRGLSGTVSLAPYDMGVLQDFEITIRPTDTEDILEIDVVLRHQAGQTGIWVRLNRIFLGDLRRQLLGWRNLRAGRIIRYISDANERLTTMAAEG